jgi:hypothetical protein
MNNFTPRKKSSYLFFLQYGPDTRHTIDTLSFLTLRDAIDKCRAIEKKYPAYRITRLEYPYPMSTGENETVLSEQIV